MIEKLIANFPDDERLEKEWLKEKARAIAEYEEYEPGHSTGFFGWKDGRYVKRPDIGAAKIAAKYPNGAQDYLKDYQLTGEEARDLCLKIGQLIEVVNKLNAEDHRRAGSGESDSEVSSKSADEDVSNTWVDLKRKRRI